MAISDGSTYYELLQVTPDADQHVIKAAYLSQVKRLHPDTNPNADTRLLGRINEAYDVLGDPTRRKEYDEELARAERAARAARSARSSGAPSASRTQGVPPPPPPGPPPAPRGGVAPAYMDVPLTWTYVEGPTETKNGIAIAGVFFGVLGLCLGPFGFIPALFMGFAGSKRAKKGAPHGGLATTAIVLGFIGMAFFALLLAQGFFTQMIGALVYSQSASQETPAPASSDSDSNGGLPAGSCRLEGSADGPLPDADCTPGVLVANAGDYPMCEAGFKPTGPSSDVAKTRRQSVASAYSSASAAYTAADVGFLIPRELGGSWAVANLWPVKTYLNQKQTSRLLDRLCGTPRTLTVEELAEAARAGRLRELAAAPSS